MIATNVRRLRSRPAPGWTQDDVAARMRALGFSKWTGAVVAAVETDGRRLDLGELVGLAVTFNCPLADLVGDDPAQPSIALPGGPVVSRAAAVSVITGAAWRQKPAVGVSAPRLLAAPSPAASRFPEERTTGTEAGGLASELAVKGLLEQRLARRFDVTPREVVSTALRLWGQPPTEERDRRAAERRAGKQHVSREIIRELGAAFERQRVASTAADEPITFEELDEDVLQEVADDLSERLGRPVSPGAVGMVAPDLLFEGRAQRWTMGRLTDAVAEELEQHRAALERSAAPEREPPREVEIVDKMRAGDRRGKS